MGRAFAERKSGATGQKVGVDPSEGRPLLSVIVPVFNEQDTIGELLKRVLAVECAK